MKIDEWNNRKVSNMYFFELLPDKETILSRFTEKQKLILHKQHKMNVAFKLKVKSGWWINYMLLWFLGQFIRNHNDFLWTPWIMNNQNRFSVFFLFFVKGDTSFYLSIYFSCYFQTYSHFPYKYILWKCDDYIVGIFHICIEAEALEQWLVIIQNAAYGWTEWLTMTTFQTDALIATLKDEFIEMNVCSKDSWLNGLRFEYGPLYPKAKEKIFS